MLHLVTQVNHSFDVVSTVGIEEGIYDLCCIDPRHGRHPVIEYLVETLDPQSSIQLGLAPVGSDARYPSMSGRDHPRLVINMLFLLRMPRSPAPSKSSTKFP